MWALLAILFFALLTHVCALPVDADEASPVPESHHDSPGDAFHAASCDGMAAETAELTAPVLTAVPGVLWMTPLPILGVPVEVPEPTPPESRPLFLLHAVLLI